MKMKNLKDQSFHTLSRTDKLGITFAIRPIHQTSHGCSNVHVTPFGIINTDSSNGPLSIDKNSNNSFSTYILQKKKIMIIYYIKFFDIQYILFVMNLFMNIFIYLSDHLGALNFQTFLHQKNVRRKRSF